MTAIRAAKLARAALLTGPPVFRVNGIVRETLVSETQAQAPSDVAPRVWVVQTGYVGNTLDRERR